MSHPGPFTGKIAIAESTAHPLCPWCEAPLARIHWHKVRGGPALLNYVAVLSCTACRAVLDILEGGGRSGGAPIT